MVGQVDRISWIAEQILPAEPRLRRWLAGFSGIEVDDVVQETYALLMDTDISHVQSPQAYLFTIARNVVLQHHRRAKIISFVALAEFDAASIIEDGPSIEDAVSSRLELRRLQQMMAELPDKCRDVLVLRRVEGWSQRKVAGHLDVTENVVEKQLARALRLLGQAFAHRAVEKSEVQRADLPLNASKLQVSRD